MTKLLAVCCIAMFAGFAIPTSAQEKPQPLRLTWGYPEDLPTEMDLP